MAPVQPTDPIPVYLLTGFLGSGKTTLLSRLVHQPAFSDTAVIINEFGAVALDHVLLETSDDRDVVVLDSGCLCCASNSPLQESLESLYYRRLRAEVPAFMRVVVETSGLADPLPLVNALGADPSVTRHFRFAGVVTTVDAVNGMEELARWRECALQLAVADRVVLTKTDLSTASQTAEVRQAIALANPEADLVTAGLPTEAILPDILDGLVRVERRVSLPSVGEVAKPQSMARFSHLLRYGIASHVVRVERRVSWADYAHWVARVQRGLGERLLRVKGILHFEDGRDYAVHGARHLFAPPQAMNVTIPDTQRGILVLITSHADPDEIAHQVAPLTHGE